MTVVTTVELRNNMKEILEKSNSGEQVIVKYYNQSFLLKPTLLKPKKTAKKMKKKKLSPQAKIILRDMKNTQHQEMVKRIKEQMPELYSMNLEQEKEYIRNERFNKYE
jgi:primosomal protein N''